MPDSSMIMLSMYIRQWFQGHGLEPPSIIRLRNKEEGMKFAELVKRDFAFQQPILGHETKIEWKPELSYVELAGIRFVWPMPN